MFQTILKHFFVVPGLIGSTFFANRVQPGPSIFRPGPIGSGRKKFKSGRVGSGSDFRKIFGSGSGPGPLLDRVGSGSGPTKFSPGRVGSGSKFSPTGSGPGPKIGPDVNLWPE